MKLGCLFGHRWNQNGTGCRCEKCGVTRDTGHDWDGCRCRVCGKTRDEGHVFIYRASVNGAGREVCRGQCRICGKTVEAKHQYEPAGGNCRFRCGRCGKTVTRHDFRPVPGRCAEICSVCGEERDYEKIALDISRPDSERADAVARLKKASMLPEQLRKNCAAGEHIWVVTKENPQQFQGGASSIEYTCTVCGKKKTEVDWGG